MEVNEALNVVNQALKSVVANRETHVTVEKAFAVLNSAIGTEDATVVSEVIKQ